MAAKRPRKKKRRTSKRPIRQYDHRDKKRVNNPPVGLVTPETDPIEALMPSRPVRAYDYPEFLDPHLDPHLIWCGKAERTSFEVPTVSLHVHERIDPKTIIEAVRVRNGNGNSGGGQMPLFASPEENPPLRDAIEFYKHLRGWTNRLIAGDSLLVMNSLLEKEGLGGQVQMVYIDPPYGIRYGSNFQPFVNKRDVKDGSDDDLTLEPETLKAFRDTWELGIHSYLTYLRDRLLLAKELLHESGSCFVQISDENLHLVRNLMDEVFNQTGVSNFCGLIAFRTTAPLGSAGLATTCDYLLWYAKDKQRVKFRSLFVPKPLGEGTNYMWVEDESGDKRRLTKEESKEPETVAGRLFYPSDLASSGYTETCTFDFMFNGIAIKAGKKSWRTTQQGVDRLIAAGRIMTLGEKNRPCFIQFHDDNPLQPLSNVWIDTRSAMDKKFVVETDPRVIERCLLMTTDPGDLVLDPTCGSGTTAYVAEQWGRRWITTDTSRVAITLAKQRLMTATFDYYKLRYEAEAPATADLRQAGGDSGVTGVSNGFIYKTVPHITLKSIANNPEIKEGMSREEIDAAIAKYADQETLYDQPEKDRTKARVTGPFTVEAVPAAVFGAPQVRAIDDGSAGVPPARELKSGPSGQDARGRAARAPRIDASIAREGETLRQSEWRAELLKTGIRAKHGEKIEFTRVEPLGGTRWLSADAETKEPKPRRAVVCFGPEHAPLEQRQVEKALEEAYTLVPKPALVIFAALQFDPEAAKDIDETNWPGVTLLKAQMNGDLVTEDLKKKRSSNESFWLIGQPDVEIRRHGGTKAQRHEGKDKAGELYEVEVHGFDYYNPKNGKVESGGTGNIAMWMLDTDYDGRSVYARQVFFPMSGAKDGWARLAKNLKAEIDPDLIEHYRGTVSLPFAPGKHKRIAVKIVDDRGIESLRVMDLQGR